jgi:hypothetical protein
MHRRWIEAVLLAGLALATAGPLAAQQRQPLPAGQPSIMNDEEDTPPPPPASKPARTAGQKETPAFEHDPDLDASDQFAPSQVDQTMPGAVSMPSRGSQTRARAAARGSDAAIEPGTPARPSRQGKQHVVACSGVFGQDSSHAKLAMAFQSRNVSFTQVDASAGGKAMASVLYAKDPKQRLEIWWSKSANRSDTHLIVINGQSDWIAPGELHLGMTLAELEKLNGKPFKLSGFDKDHVAALTDWGGGQLGAPTGGCKIGINLRPDPKTPSASLGDLSADHAFTSSDAALRAVNLTVSEILIAY